VRVGVGVGAGAGAGAGVGVDGVRARAVQLLPQTLQRRRRRI